MTNWLPELQKTGNPLYIDLADAIERDINQGKLAPGAKLPPQRNLAFDIGVTVGTVSRGYSLACERGLVSGEIGRGTYVLEKNVDYSNSINAVYVPNATTVALNEKLNFDYTTAIDVGQEKLISEASGNVSEHYPTQIIDYIRDVPPSWAEAGQQWLSTGGWIPETEDVVSTNGALAAAMATMVSITAPGDKIAFEGLSYCSFARSTTLLGRRVIMAEFDDQGLIPESFERLCAQQHPKILYLMPSVQNPTLARLPVDRREEIADIAHRYNVWIIEDMIYGPQVDDDFPPLAYFAPERTFHIGGLSKAVSAGLRAGWVSCPPRYASRITNTHNLVTGGGSFWQRQLAADIVLSGTANEIKHRVQADLRKRWEIILTALGDHKFNHHPHCPFIWMHLPEPWNSGSFINALAENDIIASDEDDFKPARSNQVFHGVRIGFSSPRRPEDLVGPINIIRNLLDSGVSGFGSGLD